MNTPICDFVRAYAESDMMRLHMPGHKGESFMGIEQWDITEIEGADALYQANGIILESEKNAGTLFGCHTFYSTEGSSHSIRAMLYLTALYAKKQGKQPLVLAARNAHRAFTDAAALADVEVEWLCSHHSPSYVSCVLSAQEVEQALLKHAGNPIAVYVTSPDYLGNMTDIAALSQVCHRHGVLLLVDNAHGAYLKFLTPSLHPIDLGADLCCDSAHKTLPVLTGGAYLHIAHHTDSFFCDHAKSALALFGSTSPSYLILQSLDRANRYLQEHYPAQLAEFVLQVRQLAENLQANGYTLCGAEPLKIVLDAKAYGYTGTHLAHILLENHMVCEFADRDFVVLMLTPQNTDLAKVQSVLCAIPCKTAVLESPPPYHLCEKVLSIREATFSQRETIAVENSIGRVLASANSGCPPAVPIVVCGERIDAKSIETLLYYGITTCDVIV